MMYSEFKEIAGYEVSYEDYDNIIEPMYMALGNVSKQDFVKMHNRSRFEVKKAEPKLIKVMNIADRSGCLKTPNGCYSHLVDVEVTKIDVRTGKMVVKVIEDSYRLGYSADFNEYDSRIERIEVEG